MKKLILDFMFNEPTSKNQVGPQNVTFNNASTIQGPNQTVFGNFPDAILLGEKGKASCDIHDLEINTDQFCINTCFKAVDLANTHQTILSSDLLPFSICLINDEKKPNHFHIVLNMKADNQDWAICDTKWKNNSVSLQKDTWYTLSMVYDIDTIGLFIDGQIVSVHSFPDGRLSKSKSGQGKLFIATDIDGNSKHFNGALSYIQFYNGIPYELESQMDDKRSSAEWFITYKYELLKSEGIDLGARISPFLNLSDNTGVFQVFEHGLIMFNNEMGVAFEVHAPIFEHYSTKSYDIYGCLISDMMPVKSGKGYKLLTKKCGLYYSEERKITKEVWGEIYKKYEKLEETKGCGFPINTETQIIPGSNIFKQMFEECNIYHNKNLSDPAYYVKGVFLDKTAHNSACYPTTDPLDLRGGEAESQRFRFFNSTGIDPEIVIYHKKSDEKAFTMTGGFLWTYEKIGATSSELGLPTSEIIAFPNPPQNQFGIEGYGQTFENGCFVCFANNQSINVVYPFKIFLNRLDTQESEGHWAGPNDLYIKDLYIKEDGIVMNSIQKYPEDDSDWANDNSPEINLALPSENEEEYKVIKPNNLMKSVELYFHVKDCDSENYIDQEADEIGEYKKILNVYNLWGLIVDSDDNYGWISEEDEGKNGIYHLRFNGEENDGLRKNKFKGLDWSIQPQRNIDNLTEIEKWWGVENRVAKLYESHIIQAFNLSDDLEWHDWTDPREWFSQATIKLIKKNADNTARCFGMCLEDIYARKGRSMFSMPVDRFKWHEIKNEITIRHLYSLGREYIMHYSKLLLKGSTHNPVEIFKDSKQDYDRKNLPILIITSDYMGTKNAHAILPIKWDKTNIPWKIEVLDPNFPGQIKTLTVDPKKNEFKYLEIYQGTRWTGGRFFHCSYSLFKSKPDICFLGSLSNYILSSDSETVSIRDSNGKNLDSNGQEAINTLKSGKELSDEYFISIPIVGDESYPNYKILVQKRNPNILQKDFHHNIRSQKPEMEYFIKTPYRAVKIYSKEMKDGEIINISSNNDNTNECYLKVDSRNTKRVSISITNKLGPRDFISTIIENIPVDMNNNLDLKIRPGIAGVEIKRKDISDSKVRVKISSSLRDSEFSEQFSIPVKNGFKMLYSGIGQEKKLTIKRLDYNNNMSELLKVNRNHRITGFFEIEREKEEYSFVLKASNGKVLLKYMETQKTKQECLDLIKEIKKYGLRKENYVPETDTMTFYLKDYPLAKANNHYSNKKTLKAGVETTIRNLQFADIIDKTL